MTRKGLTIKNTGGLPYGGIKIKETPLFHQFRKYYRTTYPNRDYPGDLSFNIQLYRLYEKYYNRGVHIYISSVYNLFDKRVLGVYLDLYYRGYNRDTVESSKGERKRKIVFFNLLKKIWKNNSKIPITDFELNEFVAKKLASDKNFNLEDYLKHINSKPIPQNNLNRQNFEETMSNSKILIPKSGGITIPKVKNFSNFKIIFMYTEPPQTELTRFGWHYGVHNGGGFGAHYNPIFPFGIPRGIPYPGDYSFNFFLNKFINEPKRTPPFYQDFKNYLDNGGTVPHIKTIPHSKFHVYFGPGTILNPQGITVSKVAFFDDLKKIWNRYYHKKSYTDFELNEKFIQLLRNIPNFNIESYLKEEQKPWETFKARFPDADLNDFTGEHQDSGYNIYYKNTQTEILGDHPAEKFDDSVRKSLGLTNDFPMSLQLILNNKYPIPGTDYDSQPSNILSEFEISVSNNQSFHAKFMDIFKETTVHFHSAAQSNRFIRAPNTLDWPQQLNWAVWCATSGCGISQSPNEYYPKRIKEFINFHIYFTIRRLLWEAKIPLPGDPFFNQTSNHRDLTEYRRLCQEFNIDSNSDFRFRGGKNNGLGTIHHKNGGIPAVDEGLEGWPNSSPIFHDEPGIGFVDCEIYNLTKNPYNWFTPEKGKGLTKVGLGRLNRSVEAFVYCIVGAEVDMRSSIVDIGEGQNVQEKMIKLFEKAVIEEDLAKSVQRYQLVIQEAKLKLNFAFAPNIWLFPSNMIINTESVIGYNNFLVKAKLGMTFGENKLINNQLKNVGIAHNLGTHKTILPHIVEKKTIIKKKTDDSTDHIVPDVNTDSDNHSFTRINSKPKKPYSSHDLNKTILIGIAAISSYMIFR